MRIENNDQTRCRRLQSHAGLAPVANFCRAVRVSRRSLVPQQRFFIASYPVLFPGLIVLPAWCFGPWPGLVLSIVIWMGIERRAVQLGLNVMFA